MRWRNVSPLVFFRVRMSVCVCVCVCRADDVAAECHEDAEIKRERGGSKEKLDGYVMYLAHVY